MPSAVDGTMSASDFDLLKRYWHDEPWGSWRDNLHAAIIAREVRRGNFKGNHELSKFMVQPPKKFEEAGKKSVFDFFKSIAKRKPLKKGTKDTPK